MSRRLATCVLALALASCTSAPESTEAPHAAESASTVTARPAAARADVKTLHYEIEIAAPVERVWSTMLSDAGYRHWTSPFMTGSYFEGSWAEGARMRFLAPGGSGMVAEIAANRPREFLSIRHLGYVMNGVEDTTSEGVTSWAPAYENYRFESVPGGTRVTIEQDVLAGFEAYMDAAWPRALAALAQICEDE